LSLQRLVLTHKDRLLRFGAELVFALCATKHVEVVIINRMIVSSRKTTVIEFCISELGAEG